jgi:endonuclease/exonuclease/phosphatase family metal-dependent hydrolase
MKKILKIVLYLLIFLLLAFGGFLVYATVLDYKPEEQMNLYENSSPDAFNDTSVINLMIWNIGYAGLGAETDFFYDGGKNVRASREHTIRNLNAIQEYLNKQDTVDFFLLQEVDINSKRSYGMNQYDSLVKVFPDYIPVFAPNYDVFFVPVPINKPMGRVKGGLLTLSRYKALKSTRYSFPGNFEWPKSLFMLDRCFLVNRYPLENEKELLVINTHNSAYDDGSLRQQQMQYLKDFLITEYRQGNYIIVGGDWNQSPPGHEADYSEDIPDTDDRQDISADYLPAGWTWMYDSDKPTNRRLKKPYERGKTPTALIDFYLLSPNIESLDVQTIDLKFEHSDHQPVRAAVKLKALNSTL